MSEKIKELYAVYGELKVQEEIIQGRIVQVKAQIQQELNKASSMPVHKIKKEDIEETDKSD